VTGDEVAVSPLADAEVYNYFRDYDPSIGRYVESDPMGLIAGLNSYAYVRGDPIAKSDVTGLLENGSSGGGSDNGEGPYNHCVLTQQILIGFRLFPGTILPILKFLCIYDCATMCDHHYKVPVFIELWNFPWQCQRESLRRDLDTTIRGPR
jgi:RHS repeat-associated protein